jgi:hypothetical protein
MEHEHLSLGYWTLFIVLYSEKQNKFLPKIKESRGIYLTESVRKS